MSSAGDSEMLPTTEQTPLTIVEVVDSDSPNDAELIAKLPPMPKVARRQQLLESTGGFIVVSLTIAWVIGLTHFVTLRNLDGAAADHLLWFFYSCAVVALAFLAGIYTSDPGVIPRTPQTCLPLPEEVKARLANNQDN